MAKKVKVNKIKCLECGTILESKFRHDFQQCDCKNESYCDGGQDYQRVGGVDMNKIQVLDKNNNLVVGSIVDLGKSEKIKNEIEIKEFTKSKDIYTGLFESTFSDEGWHEYLINGKSFDSVLEEYNNKKMKITFEEVK